MVKFKDFSRPLSIFPVLFKANLIFKDFLRQSCIFKYFSSMWERTLNKAHHASRGGVGDLKYLMHRFCLFVFVALRPKSTAMVIAGRSVPLTTLFPRQA